MYRNSALPPLTPVVKNIIILNVLVFIAQLTFQNNQLIPLNDLFTQHHFLSKDFRPWQLLTAVFMHGSWSHLFGNMIAVYVFGSWLERVWPPKKFLLFYLVCGIGAGIISGVATYIETMGIVGDINNFLSNSNLSNFNQLVVKHQLSSYKEIAEVSIPWNQQPGSAELANKAFEVVTLLKTVTTSGISLGASGAVFGLIAGSAYLFPNDTIYLQFFIPVKIKWFALIYAGVELYLALQNNPQDQVGHVAHLGGAAIGFILVWYWNKTNRKTFY